MSTVRRSSVSRRRSSHRESLGSASLRPRSQERSMRVISTLGGEQHDNGVKRAELERCASDPFDAATDDFSSASETDLIYANNRLPTLRRYPVAETRDKNCWSEPDIKGFHVRGKDYLRSRKKVDSGPYLLKARGCDVLLADSPQDNIGHNPAVLGGALRKVPTFIINLRFPWGYCVFYFEIPSRYCPFLAASQEVNGVTPSMEGMTAAERNLARFFLGNDAYRNNRLKLIPYVTDGPWVARSLVTGKPAIIGNKLPVRYTYGPPEHGKAEYLEADLDIGSSSKTAKKIVSVCRRYMHLLTADVGFVIEGKTAQELPEQMMGAIRIQGADPLKAPTVM